ncbi:hypothetical protein KCP69_20170 [Salmonella enterica subsp. enterica]|nr:hypothetical protein KCP69_20170 [Salmonella enterica subsp. enterica]
MQLVIILVKPAGQVSHRRCLPPVLPYRWRNPLRSVLAHQRARRRDFPFVPSAFTGEAKGIREPNSPRGYEGSVRHSTTRASIPKHTPPHRVISAGVITHSMTLKKP